MPRDSDLLLLRPTLDISPASSPAEQFQNETLRPVLKLQHDILTAAWHRYAAQQKDTFYRLNRPQQQEYLRHALKTNRALRSFCLGIVCGVFTQAEWAAFRQNEKELTRRVITMLTERLIGADGIYG